MHISDFFKLQQWKYLCNMKRMKTRQEIQNIRIYTNFKQT